MAIKSMTISMVYRHDLDLCEGACSLSTIAFTPAIQISIQ